MVPVDLKNPERKKLTKIRIFPTITGHKFGGNDYFVTLSLPKLLNNVNNFLLAKSTDI